MCLVQSPNFIKVHLYPRVCFIDLYYSRPSVNCIVRDSPIKAIKSSTAYTDGLIKYAENLEFLTKLLDSCTFVHIRVQLLQNK